LDIITLCLGCMEEKSDSKICPRCGYAKGAAPESSLHLPPGTVLQGKYLLGYALGQGGFGITYLAWDNNLKLKLAIKEYLPQQLAYRTDANTVVKIYRTSLAKEFSYGREKFMEEAQTLARFNEHPNIVTVRDYFEANNTAYLVMNYHEGVTLQSYLESKGGRIPVDQTLSIFMPVLDALKEVHAAGILHRDISPDNLLIDKTGRVILIDFGAARQAMGEKSKSLSVIMKAGYSPPEQYQSRGNQGPWTDIYAVAATMYRALTGHTPLEAIDRMAEDDLIVPSKLGVVIEPKQEEALLKALEVKAKDRYQTVEQFQTGLLEVDIDSDFEEAHFRMGAEKPAKDQVITMSRDKAAQPDGTSLTVSEKALKYAAAIVLGALLFIGVASLFGSDSDDGGIADTDVPLEEEVSVPIRNILGNRTNGGLVTIYEDHIYFRGDDGHLYRSEPDGSGLIKMNNTSSMYINVHDDWIYYTNQDDGSRIYKMRTDGSDVVKLNDDFSYSLHVTDEFIYYIQIPDREYNLYGNICRIRKDGSECRELLDGEVATDLILSGDYLYYSSKDGIYRMDTEGNNKSFLVDSKAFQIVISDDWLYFVTDIAGSDMYMGGENLYRIKTDGNSLEKIYSLEHEPSEWFYHFNVSGDKVYFIKMEQCRPVSINVISVNEKDYNTLIYRENSWLDWVNLLNDKVYYRETQLDGDLSSSMQSIETR
jgi:serine/threonine protein kinase